MIHPDMGLGIKELSSPSWAYGGAWNQNEGKIQTEGKALDRAEERSGKGVQWNPTKKLYNLAIVEAKLITVSSL